MERLTRTDRNYDGTAISKESVINGKTGGISDYGSRIITKLADYEDAEEQGLLLRLPCKVGDTVYRIMQHDNFIMKSTVEEFVFTNIVYVIVRDELFNSRRGIPYCEKGKTWFLTKEEAEQKLKEMNEHDGE